MWLTTSSNGAMSRFRECWLPARWARVGKWTQVKRMIRKLRIVASWCGFFRIRVSPAFSDFHLGVLTGLSSGISEDLDEDTLQSVSTISVDNPERMARF